jgi:branched-chain amino acid transport system ATP-binding protein
MEDILVTNKVTKVFGGLAAIKDVSLTVSKGIRLAIIGPNGAGKTTLFNLFTGEFKPTSGTIHFEKQQLQGLKPHAISKKGIGRTFQIVRVFDEMPVYDNILIGAIAKDLHFTPSKEQHQATEQALEMFKLQDHRDVMAKHLTLSAKKRVGLAVALVGKPRLLLLDECMAGLTFVEIDEMLELLRKINTEMGVTLVVVEHVMKVVMELCERIVVLASGEKIAEGTPREIATNRQVIDVYLGDDKSEIRSKAI